MGNDTGGHWTRVIAALGSVGALALPLGPEWLSLLEAASPSLLLATVLVGVSWALAYGLLHLVLLLKLWQPLAPHARHVAVAGTVLCGAGVALFMATPVGATWGLRVALAGAVLVIMGVEVLWKQPT